MKKRSEDLARELTGFRVLELEETCLADVLGAGNCVCDSEGDCVCGGGGNGVCDPEEPPPGPYNSVCPCAS